MKNLSNVFDCCKYCGDKRTIGCHGKCKDYMEAVEEYKKINSNKEKRTEQELNDMQFKHAENCKKNRATNNIYKSRKK